MFNCVRDLVMLIKIQKSEKNSEVGGWIKPQLAFLRVFFAYIFPKKWINSEWLGSIFFSDFFIF